MFNPDTTLKIQNNSAVLTVGALEQLGKNFKKFINFLIKKKLVFILKLLMNFIIIPQCLID